MPLYCTEWALGPTLGCEGKTWSELGNDTNNQVFIFVHPKWRQEFIVRNSCQT